VQLPADLQELVTRALAEDIGSGDLTAQLIDAATIANAELRVRERAVLCGSAWFSEVFRQIDPQVSIDWRCTDGDLVSADTIVCALRGRARSLLTGERTAMNLLQTLSGTATAARRCADAVAGTTTRILDTRKTLPGLRLAQKYAVHCGGAVNHRIGLFDAVLIKENHISAAGGIAEAVSSARNLYKDIMIEIEVETIDEFRIALETSVDRIMLDNFPVPELHTAVRLREAAPRRIELEASGGFEFDDLATIAATGVDYISTGSITKHLRAVDFSLRFV
jgi:nicotinate-nucleotide pyrophosphorylase (carboxylating)